MKETIENEIDSIEDINFVELVLNSLKDKKSKESGIIKCSCSGDIHWKIHSNGHVWAKCIKCGNFIMS